MSPKAGEDDDVRLRQSRAQGPEFAFRGFGKAQAHGSAAAVKCVTRWRGVGATRSGQGEIERVRTVEDPHGDPAPGADGQTQSAQVRKGFDVICIHIIMCI